jgi:hypothetical protein
MSRVSKQDEFANPNIGDPNDFFESKEFLNAAVEVAEYVKRQKIITLAGIARKFPEHVRYLDTIMVSLKAAGEVYWDESKPLPTLVYYGDKRPSDLRLDWRGAADRTWQQRVAEEAI